MQASRGLRDNARRSAYAQILGYTESVTAQTALLTHKVN